jgi:hypothetical protein
VKSPVAPAIVQDALDHATGSGFIKETATGPQPALKNTGTLDHPTTSANPKGSVVTGPRFLMTD